MTAEEALALVRHAFRRDAWRLVDPMAVICRLHGVPDHRRLRRSDYWREYEAEFRGAENAFFDLSYVSRPADRIAFHTYQEPGAAVGHTAGLDRVEL